MQKMLLEKSKIPLNNIKKDLAELEEYDAVVYGSYLNSKKIHDVDVAVVTRIKNKEKNLKIWQNLLGRFPQQYDIKIFELLPIQIKYSIITNYQSIKGNQLDISEYFYQYRKIWNDCKHRIENNQFVDYKEKIALMRNYKNITGGSKS